MDADVAVVVGVALLRRFPLRRRRGRLDVDVDEVLLSLSSPRFRLPLYLMLLLLLSGRRESMTCTGRLEFPLELELLKPNCECEFRRRLLGTG